MIRSRASLGRCASVGPRWVCYGGLAQVPRVLARVLRRTEARQAALLILQQIPALPQPRANLARGSGFPASLGGYTSAGGFAALAGLVLRVASVGRHWRCLDRPHRASPRQVATSAGRSSLRSELQPRQVVFSEPFIRSMRQIFGDWFETTSE